MSNHAKTGNILIAALVMSFSVSLQAFAVPIHAPGTKTSLCSIFLSKVNIDREAISALQDLPNGKTAVLRLISDFTEIDLSNDFDKAGIPNSWSKSSYYEFVYIQVTSSEQVQKLTELSLKYRIRAINFRKYVDSPRVKTNQDATIKKPPEMDMASELILNRFPSEKGIAVFELNLGPTGNYDSIIALQKAGITSEVYLPKLYHPDFGGVVEISSAEQAQKLLEVTSDSSVQIKFREFK